MRRFFLQKRVGVVAAVALVLAWWALRTPAGAARDDREEIVFFAGWMVGDDIYGVIDRFEKLHPEYRVTTTTSSAQDETGDAQRLLSPSPAAFLPTSSSSIALPSASGHRSTRSKT